MAKCTTIFVHKITKMKFTTCNAGNQSIRQSMTKWLRQPN